MKKVKYLQKERRKKRVRAKIFGTKTRPRLSVYLSHRHINVQLIDDSAGRTLLAFSDRDLERAKKSQGKRTEVAARIGEQLAREAKKKKIVRIVFDRGGRKYHGRIKALAEAARKGGLKF